MGVDYQDKEFAQKQEERIIEQVRSRIETIFASDARIMSLSILNPASYDDEGYSNPSGHLNGYWHRANSVVVVNGSDHSKYAKEEREVESIPLSQEARGLAEGIAHKLLPYLGVLEVYARRVHGEIKISLYQWEY